MWVRTGAVATVYVTLIALCLALLTTDRMFILADTLRCGLRRITYSGQSFSFASYSPPCVSDWPDLFLCGSLSDLQTAGEVLIAVLGISMGLELIGAVEVILTHRLILVSLRYIGARIPMPGYVGPLAQALTVLRWVILLDPLLNLVGLLLWVLISDIPDLSRHYSVRLASSFYLQVARSALSLGLSVAVTISILEHRRENARLLTRNSSTMRPLHRELDKRQLETLSLDETASRSFAATCT